MIVFLPQSSTPRSWGHAVLMAPALLEYLSYDELRSDVSLYVLLLEIHKTNPQAVEEHLTCQQPSLRARFQAALAFV